MPVWYGSKPGPDRTGLTVPPVRRTPRPSNSRQGPHSVRLCYHSLAPLLDDPESPTLLLVCRQHRQIGQEAAVRSAASFSHGRDTPLPRSCSRANVVSDIDAERATVMWSGQIERTRPRPARPSPLAQCRALVYDAASCRRHRRTVPRTAQSRTVLMLKKIPEQCFLFQIANVLLGRFGYELRSAHG